jgi:hypothetical protein
MVGKERFQEVENGMYAELGTDIADSKATIEVARVFMDLPLLLQRQAEAGVKILVMLKNFLSVFVGMIIDGK